jgi:hypothetical protein
MLREILPLVALMAAAVAAWVIFMQFVGPWIETL